MPRVTALPEPLRGRAFAVSAGRAAGLARSRMRASDLVAPFSGVRAPSDPDTLVALCRAYRERMPEDGVFCGVTAARLWLMPLPTRWEPNELLDVAVPAPRRAVRVAGVHGHKLNLAADDIAALHGFRVTSPTRTWRDLSRVLDVPDLVAAGDRLLDRTAPLATLRALADTVAAATRTRGSTRLAVALPLLDAGSESPAESRLRAILALGGIHGWEVNFRVTLPEVKQTYRLDLAFPAESVALEYQGGYHHDLAQWRADMTRQSRLRAHGWEILELNAGDLHDPAELVHRVATILARRSGRPS